MTELERYINQYFEVEKKYLPQISDYFIRQELEKGQYFVKEGQYNSQLSFVSTGYLRVFGYHDGNDISQWICSPGDFVAELPSLMFGQASRRNISALTDCTLYSLSNEKYQLLGKQFSEWAKLEKLFLAKCFITLEDRIFSFLAMTAEERFQHFLSYKKELFNEVPHHYLASALGMTPETLSRLRKKMIS